MIEYSLIKNYHKFNKKEIWENEKNGINGGRNFGTLDYLSKCY